MPKLYRDATTGQYTTAADAAARPAETVAETVEAHHETPDLAELRRLLDAATPGPWRDEMMQGQGLTLTAIIAGKPNPDDLRVIGSTLAHNDARAIVAAVNALPALLDAAAERDALAAKVERVRALHRAVGIYDECDCDTPDPATHLDVDDVGLTCNLTYRVCAECCRDDVYQTEGCASYHAHRLDEDYHCPTIRALDEEPQPS